MKTMVNELTIEILSERMSRIEVSLNNAQENKLIPASMGIKAQIMNLHIQEFNDTDMSGLDSKALAKYWRNVSPIARELNLDVPAQGQPKKDYGAEMSTWDSLMALIIGVLTNAIDSHEDTRLADAMRSMPRSPSKNDVYGTVEACLQHNIGDKAQNRVRSHHDNESLSWLDNGMPSFNVEETQG
tara:strand:- start:15964 stop:16518 length:555 start_codon:yes stop_codon:yes gene_type:complete